jgi:SAM-dependent methyltransferase
MDSIRTLSRAVRDIVDSAKKRGVWRTIHLIGHELLYDVRNGTDTAGLIFMDELRDVDATLSVSATNYQGISPVLFRELFSGLSWPLHESTMVDFGCGKGRALLLAAEFGVKEIIGVEFSERLCEVAEANVRKYRSATNSSRKFEIVHSDATQFSIPDRADIFFFFNPFGGPVLESVLDRIEHSLRRHPRPALLIYMNPEPVDALLRRGYRLADHLIAGDARTSDHIVFTLGLPATSAQA